MSLIKTPYLSALGGPPISKDVSYNNFINNFSNKFVGGITSPKTVNEMENYLRYHLSGMYPLLNIQLSVTIDNNNVVHIHHLNDFNEKLKRFYPEALF